MILLQTRTPYIHTYHMALRCPPDAFSTEYIDVATYSRHPYEYGVALRQVTKGIRPDLLHCSMCCLFVCRDVFAMSSRPPASR